MSPAKTCDHPKRKLNTNLVKAIDALTRLQEMNVSYHLVVHMEGRSQSFGTGNVRKLFDEHKQEFDQALIDDAIELCEATLQDETPAEPNAVEVDLKSLAKEKAYALKHGQGLQRLPYPLSLMNRKEKVSYLRYLISYDRKERLGLDSTRIVAGDVTWEARFWPNEVVKWSELNINIGLLKNEHLKGESPTSFFYKGYNSCI